MSRKAQLWRYLPLATLALSTPAGLVLLLFLIIGILPWTWAFLAFLAVLLGTGVLLRQHFRHLHSLYDYLESIRQPSHRPRRGILPRPPSAGADILSPHLDAAIYHTASERERQKQELQEVTANSQAILSALPDPLLMLDRTRRILGANEAALKLLGSDLVNRDLLSVVRHPSLVAAADAVIAGEAEQEVDFQLHDDVERHFSARVVPLQTPASDGTIAIVALHDLTAAYRAERMRADFVANASHELRTPLSSLIGFIETLRGPARDDSEARESFLTIMQDQASRMIRLVEDLLSLSRIEMREHSLPSSEIALNPLLEKLLQTLEFRARDKNIRLKVELPDLPPVVGDADELTQVFQNLIDNAIKYGRPDSEVKIRGAIVQPDSDAGARRLGRSGLAIHVIDQGEGISRQHLTRLTERFYRVDTARSRELGGTGLGLAIVKHILNRHRGFLKVDSEVGRGSTFTVYLPAESRAEQESLEDLQSD
ncbi:ATP-binding protein [Fodinicurvata fenggangensis]|uniref:ATP-binding protein n=1 Tax=Fodinicurvata fenggangensis TaxID=1121830 RepID=UPI00068CD5DD|nr:ATP-binding protein [Fodinicurvata fenggangensis]